MSISITENNKTNINYKSKLEKIIETLVELGLESTIHGFPNILRTRKCFLKLMWLIFFLISASFGVYYVFSALIGYLNYEVSVKINTIKEIPTQFPTVTFYFNDFNSNPNYTLDQRLISCSFSNIKCNYTDFEDIRLESNSFRYFKFNSGKDYYGNKKELKNTNIAGYVYGLSMEIFIGFPVDFDGDYGLAAYIHNNSFNPVNNFQQVIFLSSGSDIYLKVKRQFIAKLGEPYNECKSNLINPDDYDSVIYKHMVSTSSYKYNQDDCFDLCQAKYMIDNCNKSINLTYSWELLVDNQNTCFLEKQVEFFDKNVNEYCSQFCPLECDTINYDISLKFMQYPSIKTGLNLIDNEKLKALYPTGYNITPDDLKQSMISLKIYYDDLTFTSITEDPKMLIVDLVSNMGGLLGLFIGISFLSFGEIFEVLFEIIFIMFEKQSKRIQNI